MSLVEVYGVNPFSGQSDPYISLESSVDYDQGPDGIIQNTYTLNGVLTGCSVETLSSRRDALVRSFDWKANTGIVENIEIIGVIKAAPGYHLIPSSLSFDSTNYIGALPYALNLEVFTGFDGEDSEDLINKTHTVTTDITEEGCINRSTSIGCEPNANLSGCGALDAANKWISGRLGAETKIGAITLESEYAIQSESLQIDPITSAISFSRSESNCLDGNANTADAGLPEDGSYQFVYCVDTQHETPQGCAPQYQVIDKTYRGEVAETGRDSDYLVGKIQSELLAGQSGLVAFNANYNADSESVKFEATFKVDGLGNAIHVPTDTIINKYSLSASTNYNSSFGTVTVGAVNGSVFVANPINISPFEVNTGYDSSKMIDVAKGVCEGPTHLNSQSITYNDVEGGITYSYGFSEGVGPDSGLPVVDGLTGLSEWTVQLRPPLRKYETVPNLNCDDLVYDLGYTGRGEITITTRTVSGSGYNYTGIARQKGQDLLNTMANNRSELQVTRDFVDVDGRSATYNYSASFNGNSIIESGNLILGLR